MCVWKGAKAVFKRGLLALISADMGGGGVHQSSALLVLDNPTETLNLSSALGRLYQSPVPYPSDPIIDSYPVCLFVYSEVAYWLIGNRYEHTVIQSGSQAVTSPLVITAVSCPASILLVLHNNIFIFPLLTKDQITALSKTDSYTSKISTLLFSCISRQRTWIWAADKNWTPTATQMQRV